MLTELFILSAVAVFLLRKQSTTRFGSGSTEDVNWHVKRLSAVFPEMQRVSWQKSPGDETFISGKKRAFICTRNEKGQSYDDNVMTFVILHELAHAMTPVHGHGEEWQRTFKNLLTRAERNFLYSPNLLVPQKYCRYDL